MGGWMDERIDGLGRNDNKMMQTNKRNVLCAVTAFVTELCVMVFRFVKRTTHKRM